MGAGVEASSPVISVATSVTLGMRIGFSGLTGSTVGASDAAGSTAAGTSVDTSADTGGSVASRVATGGGVVSPSANTRMGLSNCTSIAAPVIRVTSIFLETFIGYFSCTLIIITRLALFTGIYQSRI